MERHVLSRNVNKVDKYDGLYGIIASHENLSKGTLRAAGPEDTRPRASSGDLEIRANRL